MNAIHPRYRLDLIAQAMAHPAFELDTESAASIISAVSDAREAGHPFDGFTIALVNVLRRQLADSDSADRDDSDFAEGDGQTFADSTRIFNVEAA